MAINVRTWRYCGVRITETTNAGKRGKKCRVVEFDGWRPGRGDEIALAAESLAVNVLAWADGLDAAGDFDAARAAMVDMVAKAGLPAHCGRVHDSEIRGIDAPRPILSAGIEGVWDGSADEDGITLNDQTDRNNEPAQITAHYQTKARAYELAAKVWERVKQCRTFSEAGDVLTAAGCKLHYYCRMD